MARPLFERALSPPLRLVAMDGALTPVVYIYMGDDLSFALSAYSTPLVVFLVVGMPHLRVPALLNLQPMRAENREESARTPHHPDDNLSPNAKNVPWDALSTQTSVSCRRPFLLFASSYHIRAY
jgi:hypothetical protein